jgi:hypothetical protein
MTSYRYDLSRYHCATAGCTRPVVTVRQTSHPTAFYGECLRCHQRIEADMAARAERARVAADRRALTQALIEREATWSLKAMIRALSIFSLFNTDEQNERLSLARAEVRRRAKSSHAQPRDAHTPR